MTRIAVFSPREEGRRMEICDVPVEQVLGYFLHDMLLSLFSSVKILWFYRRENMCSEKLNDSRKITRLESG